MALSKDQQRRRNQRLRKQKFNPLAPSYQNKLQVKRAIDRRTGGVVQEKLQPIRRERRAEQQTHQSNATELQQNYQWYQQRAQEAFDKAHEALSNVLSTTGSTDTAAQANLIAALNQSREGDRAQASTIGGVLPEGVGGDAAAAAAGLGSSSRASLANLFGQNAAFNADSIARAGLGRTRSLEREKRRSEGVHKGLTGERRDVERERPSIREEQRKNILDEELAKASEREREKIARGSLNLEKRKTKEEERSNRAGESISWAQIRNEKAAIQAEIEGASGSAAKEEAEARGERYNRGVEVMQRYFENTKRKSWNPKRLYQNLTLVVDRQTALKIMSHGPPPFRKFVAGRTGAAKKKPKGPQGPVNRGGPVNK